LQLLVPSPSLSLPLDGGGNPSWRALQWRSAPWCLRGAPRTCPRPVPPPRRGRADPRVGSEAARRRGAVSALLVPSPSLSLPLDGGGDPSWRALQYRRGPWCLRGAPRARPPPCAAPGRGRVDPRRHRKLSRFAAPFQRSSYPPPPCPSPMRGREPFVARREIPSAVAVSHRWSVSASLPGGPMLRQGCWRARRRFRAQQVARRVAMVMLGWRATPKVRPAPSSSAST